MKVNEDKYIKQELEKYFYLSADSPSGLKWICDPRGARDYRAGSKSSDKRAKTQYWKVQLNGKELFVHRVICTLLYGQIPEGLVVDHIDGDGLNNSQENLRLVPVRLNNRNKRAQKNLSTETDFTGVSYVVQSTKFSGENYYYRATYHGDGYTFQKNFNIKKYGEDLAFLLALCWRNFWLSNDETYGKDHGNAR